MTTRPVRGQESRCGSIIVNYDGVAKHRTRVGERAFVGCNANLIAPLVQGIVPQTLGAIVAIPFVLLLSAYLWQLLPHVSPSTLLESSHVSTSVQLASVHRNPSPQNAGAPQSRAQLLLSSAPSQVKSPQQ